MKSFCPYSQCSHLNLLKIFPPKGGCSEGLDAFRFLFLNIQRIVLVTEETTVSSNPVSGVLNNKKSEEAPTRA